MISSYSFIYAILLPLATLAFFSGNDGFRLKGLILNALKYDPSNFVTVSVKKPLGINLEEVVPNQASGLYVSEVGEGNAKATNKIYRGLLLLDVNGVDVKNKDFDSVMDILINAPETLSLTFIDKRNVEKGPANLTVKLNNGNTIQISTLKGELLRPILLNAGVELYQGGAKFTNCGGGGTCGTCVVSVTNNADWEERPDFEAKRLKKYDTTARLSCNTVVEGDATITIAPPKIA